VVNSFVDPVAPFWIGRLREIDPRRDAHRPLQPTVERVTRRDRSTLAIIIARWQAPHRRMYQCRSAFARAQSLKFSPPPLRRKPPRRLLDHLAERKQRLLVERPADKLEAEREAFGRQSPGHRNARQARHVYRDREYVVEIHFDRIAPSLLADAKGISAILTPATPSAAFGVGEKGGADPVEMYLNDIFTVTVNMAGLPGIAVPAGKDAQGLPLGLQLIGRPFDEETLFSLGEVVEQAAGRFTPPRWW